MDETLHYAFMDESGTVGVSSGTHFLIVAVLTANEPRNIEKLIRRALKKFGSRLSSGEIKAADFEETAILRLLREIAEEEIAIVATIVDQQTILRPPKEKEEIYRNAVAQTVRRVALRFPRVEICIDKRYTSDHLRYRLEKSIRVEIEDLPHQMVLIRQENSSFRKELQAADAIAWAFFRKYERGDERFYNLIASKIIDEEVVAKKDWSGKRKSPSRGNS
jgi:hypothetical protein